MMEAVAKKGYAATTVADVVDGAKVSRRTFYQQFESKEECFLAAYDVGVEYLLGRLATEAATQGPLDWRERVRSDLRTYTDVLAGDPAFAWSLHVEILSAGPRALERRAQIFALFSERTRRAYERARREEAALPVLPADVFDIHTGGLDELIREHLRVHGTKGLRELAEPLSLATLAMFDRG
jgi:AcrR family transcriptional regulator